jgi:serine/threonine protein kinase
MYGALGNLTRSPHLLERSALQVMADRLASESPSLAGKTLGAYQIISLLGSGGMGEVYKARDSKLNRFVAIKVLPPDKTSDAAASAASCKRRRQPLRSIIPTSMPSSLSIS